MKRYRLVREYVDLYGRRYEIQELAEICSGYSIKSVGGYLLFISAKDLMGYLFSSSNPFEEVKPERWRAGFGHYYYFVAYNNKTTDTVEGGCDIDTDRYYTGNYFKTREQAEEASKRIKKVLSEYQDELLNCNE